MSHYTDFINGMLKKKEGVVYDAVSRKLGGGDWDLWTLAGRVERYVTYLGSEIYTLDGAALIEIFPPEFDTKDNSMGSISIVGSQKYRILN